jgi:hypothetical protein
MVSVEVDVANDLVAGAARWRDVSKSLNLGQRGSSVRQTENKVKSSFCCRMIKWNCGFVLVYYLLVYHKCQLEVTAIPQIIVSRVLTTYWQREVDVH